MKNITETSNFLTTNWLSLTALIVGAGGLMHSIYLGRRDNGKIVTSSEFFNYPATKLGVGNIDVRGIKVKAVNEGRRTIVLTKVQIENNDGLIYPKGLNGTEANMEKTLTEKQSAEQTFMTHANNGYLLGSDGKEKTINCWFEDTTGRKYFVKDFKKT